MTQEDLSPAANAEIWQKSLIDAALDAVLIIDENGYVVDFNPAAETTFGYKKEAVIGKMMSDLIVPPSLRKAHTDGLSRMRRTNVPKILGQRLELPAVHSNGTQFPVELIVVQVPVQPRPLYVGYVRDISDRKKAEEALRDSVKRFQALADSAPLMIWLAGRDGTVEWFNRSWLEFTGRKMDDVVGRGWIDLLHGDDVVSFMDSYESMLKSGESFSKEFRLRHADGKFRWILGNVAAALNPDGTVSGFAGSCVDITSRREAEMALRLTQFAVDTAADAIFWIRPDATLHYVNDEACRVLGYSREELLDMQVGDFSLSIPEGTWPKHWIEISKSKSLAFEAKHQRKDGSSFPVEIRANLIEFQNEQIICAFVRDVTERKQAQAKLAKAMKESQAANRAKSEFLAIVSHEMRTPLNSVLGTVDLCLQADLGDEEHEMMTICQRSGVQLKELINDMLDYSQIQAGRFSLQSRVVDMNLLFERIRNVFTQRAQEKGLEFRWQVERTIPNRLFGDERRLSQVIENLLNNAVKFTDSGYIAFRATLGSTNQTEVTLRFVVEDSGIGIDTENRERIFQRFEQIDSGPTRAFGGVGLGLSICSQLVEMMNGEIYVNDNDDGGSTFVFSVVILRGSENEDEQTQLARPTSHGSKKTETRLSGLRVLLVEDDPPSRLVAERMLRKVGVKVVAVEDGLAAVEEFGKNPNAYDVVLMDVMMPRLDGIEATKRIRQLENGKIPVVAMTAQAMLGDRERILRSEVDAYIAKPIDRNQMLSTLAGIVGKTSNRAGRTRIENESPISVVDLKALRIRCDNDDELLEEISKLFERTCDESLASLIEGLKQSDQATVVAAAHRLKGAVGNMCAESTSQLCQEIETDAKNSDFRLVHSKLGSLQVALKRLHRELSERPRSS